MKEWMDFIYCNDFPLVLLLLLIIFRIKKWEINIPHLNLTIINGNSYLLPTTPLYFTNPFRILTFISRNIASFIIINKTIIKINSYVFSDWSILRSSLLSIIKKRNAFSRSFVFIIMKLQFIFRKYLLGFLIWRILLFLMYCICTIKYCKDMMNFQSMSDALQSKATISESTRMVFVRFGLAINGVRLR